VESTAFSWGNSPSYQALTESRSSRPFPLLELPGELRNIIYHYLSPKLESRTQIKYTPSHRPAPPANLFAPLSIDKQIQKELRPVLYHTLNHAKVAVRLFQLTSIIDTFYEEGTDGQRPLNIDIVVGVDSFTGWAWSPTLMARATTPRLRSRVTDYGPLSSCRIGLKETRRKQPIYKKSSKRHWSAPRKVCLKTV
jgi:hypothetical protein